MAAIPPIILLVGIVEWSHLLRIIQAELAAPKRRSGNASSVVELEILLVLIRSLFFFPSSWNWRHGIMATILPKKMAGDTTKEQPPASPYYPYQSYHNHYKDSHVILSFRI